MATERRKRRIDLDEIPVRPTPAPPRPTPPLTSGTSQTESVRRHRDYDIYGTKTTFGTNITSGTAWVFKIDTDTLNWTLGG